MAARMPPDYALCEIYQVDARGRDDAKKKAQAIRTRHRRAAKRQAEREALKPQR